MLANRVASTRADRYRYWERIAKLTYFFGFQHDLLQARDAVAEHRGAGRSRSPHIQAQVNPSVRFAILGPFFCTTDSIAILPSNEMVCIGTMDTSFIAVYVSHESL